MIFKIKYPSEMFGLEEQYGGIWQITIVMHGHSNKNIS